MWWLDVGRVSTWRAQTATAQRLIFCLHCLLTLVRISRRDTWVAACFHTMRSFNCMIEGRRTINIVAVSNISLLKETGSSPTTRPRMSFGRALIVLVTNWRSVSCRRQWHSRPESLRIIKQVHPLGHCRQHANNPVQEVLRQIRHNMSCRIS